MKYLSKLANVNNMAILLIKIIYITFVLMVIISKYILSILISATTLLSGSGFSTLKMVCLCSGDVTISVFDKSNCEETKTIKNIPVLDHKCCEYSTTSIKLNKSVLNIFSNTIDVNFNFISLPLYFFLSENIFSFHSNILLKDFIPLLQQEPLKIYLFINNFRI